MSGQPVALADAKASGVRSLQIMADGELADFEAVIHPRAVNREAGAPLAGRGRGPAAFHATALWLRGAFAELRWEIHEVAAESDIVTVHSTWSGRHIRPFVIYDDVGAVDQAMPPTNKAFTATQSHWFRLAEGKIIEHWANRDDWLWRSSSAGSRPALGSWSAWPSKSAKPSPFGRVQPSVYPGPVTNGGHDDVP